MTFCHNCFVFKCAFFLFAAPRQGYYPHYREKEGIIFLLYIYLAANVQTLVLLVLPQALFVHNLLLLSFNCFTVVLYREAKLSQRIWLEPRISANTAKWPPML